MPTFDETKQALFSIDSNKTPGPDGFGAGFLKHIGTLWDLTVLNVYWNFF